MQDLIFSLADLAPLAQHALQADGQRFGADTIDDPLFHKRGVVRLDDHGGPDISNIDSAKLDAALILKTDGSLVSNGAPILRALDGGVQHDVSADAPRCWHCRAPAIADVLEVWGQEFMLDTCCFGMHAEIVDFLNDDPKGAAEWVGAQLEGILPGNPRLRRIADSGASLVLDFNLQLVDITFAEMKRFVATHHRHCKPPRGWRFGKGVANGSTLVGVVSVGRPVARALDQKRIVEVNRLCVDPTVASPLVWNASSMLYGWAAREGAKQGAERIITYTLVEEAGTTLRAAGWKPDRVTRRRKGWGSAARPRDEAATPNGAKVRWHRQLVANPVSVLRAHSNAAERLIAERLALARQASAPQHLLEAV